MIAWASSGVEAKLFSVMNSVRSRKKRSTRFIRAPATAYPRRSSTGWITPACLAHKQSRPMVVASRRRGAVDGKCRAGDEGRLVGNQEEGGVGDLLGFAGAAHRILPAAHLDQRLLVLSGGALLIGPGYKDPQHRRVDRAGTDCIDANFVR